jgi:hypothetical protein
MQRLAETNIPPEIIRHGFSPARVRQTATVPSTKHNSFHGTLIQIIPKHKNTGHLKHCEGENLREKQPNTFWQVLIKSDIPLRTPPERGHYGRRTADRPAGTDEN